MSARSIAACTAGLTTLVAAILVIDRGGLIAWGALLIGASLLAKIGWKPAKTDLGLAIGLASVSVLSWIGTFYYVISTWESGEVVELAIDTDAGAHTARVWVLDVGDEPLIYYDAEPEVAQALLAGKPLKLTRNDQMTTRIPKATEVDALPEADANKVFEAMITKYGDRVGVADIYYAMLGRSSDRIAVVASLAEQ
ncbi:MAG: hypothetical protein AB7I04_05570 [Pseudomonadales bacterium]